MTDERPDWVGVRAVAWVLDEAPVPAELALTLVAIARRCDESGRGSRQSAQTIAAKTGKSFDQTKRDIRELRKQGLIVPGDQSLVAHLEEWKRPTVYDVPLHLKGPKPRRESKNKTGAKAVPGGMDAPGCVDAPRVHGSTPGGGMDAPGPGCMDAPQIKPLKNPKKNPSLSAREEPASDTVKTGERDESSSLQGQEASIERRLLAKRGLTEDQIGFVQGWIDSEFPIDGPGWWITADRNGTLDMHIKSALAVYESPDAAGSGQAKACLRCDGCGSDWAGGYFTCNPCLACHGSGEALASGNRKCPQHPNEPVACKACRSERLVDPSYIEQANRQRGYTGRTPTSFSDRKRSPDHWQQPADDSEYDKPFTMRGAPVSPADQRVADGQALYNKYKRLEESA